MAEKKEDDLFETFRAGFKEDLHSGKVAVDGGADSILEAVDAYIEFARNRLKKNPVIGTYIVEDGLGLRFQDNTRCPMVYVKPRPMARDAIAITRPDGPGGILDAGAQPITGG